MHHHQDWLRLTDNKMKKRRYEIAIMTQPLGFNYGGIIQNYALQRVLTDLGYHTVTIDRGEENPHSKIKISASRFKSLILRYVFRQQAPIYLDYQKINKNNRLFISEYINMSPKMFNTAMLIDYFTRTKCGAVVVGSDQVWRPKYSPNIFNFFLDFLCGRADIKKISYAASFGTEDWEYTEQQTQLCSEFVRRFDGVSVRENSAVNLCAEHLRRKDVVPVLDPTFLLNAEHYSHLIGKKKKDIGLFTYMLDESMEKIEFMEQCAKQLNLSVHRNQAKLPPDNVELDKIKDYIIPPIEGWLQGFRDAEFIITDSFHGTVFSIINEKPFFVLVNKERGAARFKSLLGQLELDDRLIYDVDNFDLSDLLKAIDYRVVKSKLNGLINESLSFLNTCFGR